MVRILIIMLLLLPFSNGFSQTRDRKAREYYDIGCDKIIKKDLTGAIDAFSEAIRLDSGFIQAFENRGVAKFYLNDNRGAIEDFTSALRINPNDYNTHGRRGWAEFHLQQYREAIADFSKAIEGNRNNSRYYYIRGQAEYLIQDYLGAISDFNRVVKFRPGEKDEKAKAYYMMGMSKINIKQNDNGCSDLQKAVELGYSGANGAIQNYCK